MASVVSFREANERLEGLKKYKKIPRNVVFFFPEVIIAMTTEGMKEAIKMYILDENLTVVFNQIVKPGRQIKLRKGIDRHVVETSVGTPWIEDFQFLKEYV